MSDSYQELLDDVRALLVAEAKGPKRTVTLSPEVAALLDALGAPVSAPAALASPKAAEEEPQSYAQARRTSGDPPAPAPVAARAAPPPPAPPPAPAAERISMDHIATLPELAAEVAGCRRCGLCKTRTQTVFGVGDPSTDLVFVGEAPGKDEDLQGEPFVGAAGQLLTDIIEKGMKRPRASVYICNVLKCRPPGNRNPAPEEVAACEPFLSRQLALLRPKAIVALGGCAAHALLNTDASVTRLRGLWHHYRGIPLRVTYHPSYLLRQPGEKKKTWEDIQEVMKLLAGETKL